MKLRLDLDTQTADALMASAVRELRPTNLQAEVLIKRSLGLPIPPIEAHTQPSPSESTAPVGVGAHD